MTKFDLLDSSIIYNTTLTGSQYFFTPNDISNILSLTDAVIPVINQRVGVDIDLGTQSSIYQIQYKNTPLTATGVQIKYGRTLNSMYSAAPSVSGGFVVVSPTQSGYTEPRFIQIIDSFLGFSGQVNQINVINTDDEIRFGANGNLDNLTLVGDVLTSTSEIIEIPITNSGNLIADIFVCIDPDTEFEVLENLELSLTPTGTFYQFNDLISVPESIPWELGDLKNLKIKDNALWFNNPVDFSTLGLGSLKSYSSGSFNDNYTYTNKQIVEITDIDGIQKLATANFLDQSIQIFDPIFNTRRVSGLPPYTVLTGERDGSSLAYDKNDSIYFLNGKNTQLVYKYSISANSFSTFATTSGFFNSTVRQVAIINNDLYILGGSTTYNVAPFNQLWKINIITSVITQLANCPIAPDSTATQMISHDNTIYVSTRDGSGQPFFLKYEPTNNLWTFLATAFNSNAASIRGLSSDPDHNQVILHTAGTSPNENYTGYKFDVTNLSWSSYTIITDAEAIATVPSLGTFWRCGAAGVCKNGAVLAVDFDENISVRTGILKVVDEITFNGLGVTSGTWTSPPIKLSSDDNNLFVQPYIQYDKQDGVVLDAVNSLGVETIEVRGFTTKPTGQNSLQLFNVPLSTTEFLNLTTGGSSISVSGNSLILSHQNVGNTFNSAVSTFQFPFSTQGVMQYNFFYNPASNRQLNSTHYSRFYIAPYVDSLVSGDAPKRNGDSLVRTDNDSVYIEFGASTDSGGVLKAIKFFNGSVSSSATVSLTTGNFYPVSLIIDWANATYRLYLNSVLILSGVIPAIQIQKLAPNHTYEIFSACQTVSANEKYKALSISRAGNIPSSVVNYTPIFRDDTFYGVPGTPWNINTLNGIVLPKTDFTQFKFTLKSDGTGQDQAIIQGVKFPYTLVLKDTQPGDTKSVYLRYTFPPSNQTGSSTIYLKTWMRTDKQ
jgi:hypothetical protein